MQIECLTHHSLNVYRHDNLVISGMCIFLSQLKSSVTKNSWVGHYHYHCATDVVFADYSVLEMKTVAV